MWLYRRSGGKLGGKMFGAPVLLLTTTGRKSGRSWTVPLIYQTDGDRWVIIASNGGRARNPAWWLNLRSQPDASIQIARQTYLVTASETGGEDRERLWRQMADMYKGYDGYARKTTRQIPVVVLQRR
ncbi:nitroreductase family deazaflavin-dependent oxidoreductase [Micromonospora sp. RTP1Z1]|uniref:nitroreductase family deazaflavin-dependent oxidoreductase n=1 Tax=Micromonospora sp. RTP1Z1 TaxID=2994043 RepID=UPI0029C69C53|nr:nitroreductase family deazaflavin-dependent oxidoreductase [Micromonospora sp. RTP1Z1]